MHICLYYFDVTEFLKNLDTAYQCDLCSAKINTPLCQITGLDHVVVVRVVQQSLRWNAAYVEAGTSKCGVFLDADRLKELTVKEMYSFLHKNEQFVKQ